MADGSDNRRYYRDDQDGSPTSADIAAEIQKLEKKKRELEREKKNQDTDRLRQLRENVASLESGRPSPSASSSTKQRKDNASRSSFGDGVPSELESPLADAQARLQSFQRDMLNASLGGAANLNDSREESGHSVDEDDDVMSAAHKQALRANRDVLVENMTPDDIFNDLISKHILSNSDVSRIKEKNTVEAINEELLNVLVRRSDRAFHVFVASLRRTLQGNLARRLDPGYQAKNKRKRRTGELNIDVDCQHVSPASKKKYTCTCQEVEEQILIMARDAFANIRRRDATPHAFEQFRKELHATNEIIKESMEIINTLKMLCRHGDLTGLSTGSIRFTLKCNSLSSCKCLWEQYQSGSLLRLFQKNLVNPVLLRKCGARSIQLSVSISELEYLQCALELACAQQKRSKLSQRLTPMKSRLRSRNSENRCNDQVSQNAPDQLEKYGKRDRQAFQEIPQNVLREKNQYPGNIHLHKSSMMLLTPTQQHTSCLSVGAFPDCWTRTEPSLLLGEDRHLPRMLRSLQPPFADHLHCSGKVINPPFCQSPSRRKRLFASSYCEQGDHVNFRKSPYNLRNNVRCIKT